MNDQSGIIGYIIIFVVVLFIIAINISLIRVVKNRSITKSLNIFKSTYNRAKSPWQSEDEALKELSNMVDKITSEKTDEQ